MTILTRILREELKLAIFVVVVSLSLGAPLSGVKNSGVSRHNRKLPVWLNPCKLNEGPKLRHFKYNVVPLNKLNVTGRGQRASPRPLRRIRVQITSTWAHFTMLNPELTRHMCNEVLRLGGHKIQCDWLPKNQSKWYKENIKCLDKKNKVMLLLPTLHAGLQNFSASFDKFRHKTLRHNECDDKRHASINLIADRLNQLLCEVDQVIIEMGMPPPSRLSEAAGRSLMKDYGRQMTVNVVYEWGVLLAYQSFLEDWRKIVRNLVGRKGDKQCQRRQKHH